MGLYIEHLIWNRPHFLLATFADLHLGPRDIHFGEPHLATHATRGDVLPLSAQEEILERFDIHSKTLFEDAPHERLGDQWETVLHLLPTTQPAMANLGIIIFHD